MRTLLLLFFAGTGAGLAGDLPADVLRLAQFKHKVAQDLDHIGNCTCLETIERAVRDAGKDRFQFLDRVRLEVTSADGKELLTWPGGARFEDWAVTSFVNSGLVASGMFATYARNLFLRDGAIYHYVGEEDLGAQHTVHYDFHVPVLSSTYRLRSGNEVAVVPSKGSFWFEAGSLQLVRLEVMADEIPAKLGLTAAITRIHYGRLASPAPDFLLPLDAEIELGHLSGEVRRNKIQFAQCHEYRAQSSISYDSPGVTAETSQADLTRVELPDGLKVSLELESGYDAATAAIGDPVRGRVLEDVRRSGKRIIPKGAIASGRIRSMERQTRAGGFVLGIAWTALRWENNRADFHAELLEARTAAAIDLSHSLESAGVLITSGATPTTDLEPSQQRGAQIRVVSGIPGVGKVFVKGEQWRLAPGLRMVWRTLLS